MTGVETRGRTLRRVPPLAWVVTALVLVTGLVAALGGFASAPDRGRPVSAGEQVLTSRWHLRVERAALVDDSYRGSDPEPRIRVWLRAEFTGDETLCCLTEGMLEVRYGGQTGRQIWGSEEDPRSTLGYDPGVEVARVLEFPLAAEQLPAAPPDRVELVIRDERPSRSVVLTDWGLGPAVADVDLPAPDERARR